MNKEDFLAKLATVPEEEPNEEDRADLKDPCTRNSAKTPSWMGYRSTSTSSTSWPDKRGPAPSCPRPGQLFSFPSGPLPDAGGLAPGPGTKKGGIPCGYR